MTKENNSPEAFYFIFRKNRRIQVSKEEWEQDWLNWWKKNKREEESSEGQ